MKLSQTAAVITGGASGLGEATARHFAANGAQVTLLDRDVDRGQAVAAEIGGHFAETDVTSEDRWPLPLLWPARRWARSMPV